MRITTLSILSFSLVAAIGCKKKQDDAPGKASAPPPPPPPPPASAAALAKKACTDWPGFEGKGDFVENCKTKGGSAFEAVWTGEFKKNLFNEEVPSFKITNKFDRDVTWANISVWLYDKDGKLLEVGGAKRTYQNGSGILKLKAGETAEFGFGPDRKTVPAETATIVAEVMGWGWDAEPKLYFAAHAGIDNFDDRPKDGWK